MGIEYTEMDLKFIDYWTKIKRWEMYNWPYDHIFIAPWGEMYTTVYKAGNIQIKPPIRLQSMNEEDHWEESWWDD